MPTPAPTLPEVLRTVAAEHPTGEALVDGGTRLSYRELHHQVRQAARALATLGVAPGDRVGVWAPNCWQWVVLTLAATYQGAVFVPLNSRYTGFEAADILRRTRASALVLADGFLGRRQLDELREAAGEPDPDTGAAPAAGPVVTGLPELRAVIRLAYSEGASHDLAGTVAESELGVLAERTPLEVVERRADAVRPDDMMDILFTSGTTGRSKGACSAHRQTVGVARDWARCGEVTHTDRYLLVNPFFHSFGYKAGIMVCLLTGATMLPQATFQAEATMRLVETERASIVAGAPPVHQALLDIAAGSGRSPDSLRLAVTGAALVPVVLVERIQAELGYEMVLTAYGMTEAVVATMCRRGDPDAVVAGTCGRAVDSFEVRVAAQGDNTPLPPDTEGEVLLRGENVMLGYLDDPQATAEAIDAEGWLHSGDVGRLSPEGYLTITDRLKDMFIVGGFNVYPAEVEQTLARLEGVVEAAVVGVPDPRLHEVGRAYVVQRPGAGLAAQTVIDHCARHLANFKVPRSVEFVAELPRNASGKVLKRELRGGSGSEQG